MGQPVELWTSQPKNCAVREFVLKIPWASRKTSLLKCQSDSGTMTFSSVMRGSPCLPQQSQSRQCLSAFLMHQPCRLLSSVSKPIIGQERRHPGSLALVGAAAATAMPDIEERLSRFEWDTMNLADLTGMLQGWCCAVSSWLNSLIISIV